MSRRDHLLNWTEEDEKEFRSGAKRYEPRQARARQFADEMVHVLDGFLPADRDCRIVVLDYLHRLSFKLNCCIVNVPPEWDHLDKLALEKAMLETKIVSVGLNSSYPFMGGPAKEKP